MKKYFLFMIAMVCALIGNAQITDKVTATLQNGVTTTVFYGIDSFKDALAAALDEGSVITLSSGTFTNPGEIKKSIKVYGAGFQKDEANNLDQTIVNGKLTITNAGVLVPIVRVEGIYFTGDAYIQGNQTISNTEIVKCSFYDLRVNVATNTTLIRQSYIRGWVYISVVPTSFMVANCWLRGISGSGTGDQVIIDHSIITYTNNDSAIGPYYYTSNIINSSGKSITAGATCKNNVGSNSRLSNGGQNVCSGNYDTSEWTNYSTLFLDGQNNLNYDKDDGTPRTWELSGLASFMGLDGEPCGVTGGMYKWNPIPSTPRILSTSVDAKSENGKLNVTIKAEARPIE